MYDCKVYDLRVLFVEISFSGHRLNYLSTLQNKANTMYESVCLVPEHSDLLGTAQYIIQSGFGESSRTFSSYVKFIGEIRKIVRKENIDIVHFLCGDSLCRFFGLFLKCIGAKVFVTYHHVKYGTLNVIAQKRLYHCSRGIVHTESLKDALNKLGISNVEYIEYPMLDLMSERSQAEAKTYFGVPQGNPCFAALGATWPYKGLDVFIEALNQVKYPCNLLVAGQVRTYDEEYVLSHLKNPLVTPCLTLRSLTDEEFADAVQAADVLVLPYRLKFDGASGPLVIGVMHRKIIIGSNHGSLAHLIRTNDLGMAFESDNSDALASALNQYLETPLKFSEKAEQYRDSLRVEKFLENHVNMYRRYAE